MKGYMLLMIKQLKYGPIFAMHFVEDKLLYLLRENNMESVTEFERVPDMNKFAEADFPQSLSWKDIPHWYVQLESGRYFIMQKICFQHSQDRLTQDLRLDLDSDLILTFDKSKGLGFNSNYTLGASIDGNIKGAIANQHWGRLAEKVHKHYQLVPELALQPA